MTALLEITHAVERLPGEVAVLRLAGLRAAEAASAVAQAPLATRNRTVIVDTRDSDVVTLPLLAALVRLRRRCRCRGGDVVLVADGDVADLLVHSGLFRSLPLFDTVEAAQAHFERPFAL